MKIRLLFGLSCVTLLSCSSDSGSDLECGTGTVETSGECLADGSMICTGNTTYDADSATCVLSESACGEGTVLVDGTCVPFDDTLIADHEEGTEPNDGTLEGATVPEFELPAIDAAAVTLGGCVEPADFDGDDELDVDQDSWQFSVTVPTLLQVTIDGRNGFPAAFTITSSDEDLVADGWQRIGLNLTSDGASRQVFLPKAGTYFLTAQDARSILTSLPSGSDTSCYFAQVTQIAIPTPSSLTDESTNGTFGDTAFYTATTEIGGIYVPRISTTAQGTVEAFAALVDGEYFGSAAYSDNGPAALQMSGLQDGQEVLFAVDYVYSVDIIAPEYMFELGALERETLTSTPAVVTFTARADVYSALQTEVTSGDVVHVELDTEDALEIVLDSPSGEMISQPCQEEDSGTCEGGDFWFVANESGLYTILIANYDRSEGDEYSFTASATSFTPTSLTLGEAESLVFSTGERAFFSADLSDTDWLEVAGAAWSELDGVDVAIYNGGAAGTLDVELQSLISGTLSEDDPLFGHVTRDEGWGTVLVSVQSSGSGSLDFTMAERDATDLGSVDASTPVENAETIEENGTKYYFASVEVGADVTIVATPEDTALNIRVLDSDEATLGNLESEGLDGVATELEFTASSTFVAFAVENTGEADDFGLSVTVVDPPYSIQASDVSFEDVCETGTLLQVGATGGFAGTEDLSSLGFSFFGEDVSEMTISNYGWLTFEDFDSDPEPPLLGSNESPNGLVAPFGDFVSEATVCMLLDDERAIVQWEGTNYLFGVIEADHVQAQAILHASGAIDFVYGPDHVDVGLYATVGIENLAGDKALAPPFSPAADSSITFTPQ